MSDPQQLLDRARVIGRVADHLVPLGSADPVRVVVQAESLVFAAEFAADVAAAARLRGVALSVDAGLMGDRVAPGWDEVIALTTPEEAAAQEDATIVISLSDGGRPALSRVGSPDQPVYLFSYGTLQQEEVQRSNFGRLLHGSPDLLIAHRSDWVQITDPAVIAASGTDRHPIVRPTGDPSDSVAGTLFVITPAELAAADTYEVDDYRRFQVRLNSGTQAWVYLAAEFAASVAE
jgi:hypothetical protein